MDGNIARKLLRIAEDILLRTSLTFQDSDKTEEKGRNDTHFEIQRFMDRVRRNEKLETFLNRRDEAKSMKLEIGLSDHEAVQAIVREILDIAKKLAKKHDMEIKES
jgi:uncharacterized membrane protein YccC